MRVLTALLTLVVIFMMSACSPEPITLEDIQGAWESTGDDSDYSFSASVVGDDLEIHLHLADGTKGVYWKGSIEMPEETVQEFMFFSTANKEVLDMSLFGSGLDRKAFSYHRGAIEFEFEIVGTIRSISLEKQ